MSANLTKYVFGSVSKDPEVGSVDFGPPDPDPTCNNRFIKLFSS